MSWVMLVLASLFEITWAVSMKYSEGFTRIVPSAVTVAGYIASAVFLALALKNLPLGTAYAMWTGAGIIGTTILGIFLFGEKLTPGQGVCLFLIVAGIAGLKILGSRAGI